MSQELSTIFSDLWVELGVATAEGSHPWRICSLATAATDGFPQVRKVVLRQADSACGELFFFTDPRTPKWEQLRANPRAEALFWSGDRKVQVRCEGRVRLHQGDELAQSFQEKIPEHAAGDYAARNSPGEVIDGPENGQEIGSEWSFGVIVLAVTRLDWLQLDRAGHRRAWARKEGGDWQMSWVQP